MHSFSLHRAFFPFFPSFVIFLTLAASGRGEPLGLSLVTAARQQVGQTVRYDPAYVSLSYPGGDVPIDRGVCTDVVIRAFRQAFQQDLQVLVHEDMAGSFSAYPKLWGLKKTDKNIDHRRAPNLQTLFKRRGLALPVSQNRDDYLPGDIVTCTVPPHLPHIMIVSSLKTPEGKPLVIHNIGSGAQEEDRLFSFTLTGHYRWKVPNSPVTIGPSDPPPASPPSASSKKLKPLPVAPKLPK